MSDLTHMFDMLVAELLELSKLQANPGTSLYEHRAAIPELFSSTSTLAVQPLFALPQNSLGQSLRFDEDVEVCLLQLLCDHFKNCWSKAEVRQVINDELK